MKTLAIALSFLPLALALGVLAFQRWRSNEERKERDKFDRIMKAGRR